MKIYIATNSEIHCGESGDTFVLGAYTTKEKAMAVLEKEWLKDAERNGLEEYGAIKDYKRTDFENGKFSGFTMCDRYDSFRYMIQEEDIDTDK